MGKIENMKPEQPKAVEKSDLLDSILEKLEREFREWGILKRMLYSTTEAARMGLEVSPMPYKQRKVHTKSL